MSRMSIYIASSWRNQHAVELLTYWIRSRSVDFEVWSFVENNFGEGHAYNKNMNFEEWVWTDQAEQAFEYDTKSAMNADLVIYIGPSGKDAAAEVGMAYASGVPIIGLYAKGEDFGLMRRMMDHWCKRYDELISLLDNYKSNLEAV